MAFATFLMLVVSLVKFAPRGHARSEPGLASNPLHATSKSISVLLVPSVMSVIFTEPGGVGLALTTLGWYGRMPSVASPPCPFPGLLMPYAAPVTGLVPFGPAFPA